jgi:Protein of unknown function (DUF1444)
MNRLYVTALALVLLSNGGCRHRAEDAFSERVAARARRQPGVRMARVADRFHLTITPAKGEAVQMYLDNLWRDCQNRPETCDDSIERALQLHGGQMFDEAFIKGETVRAVLKDRLWMENVDKVTKAAHKAGDKAADNALVSRPFVADLSVVYVFDLPDGMRMINHGDLAKLKLDVDGLHRLAVVNLETNLPPLSSEPIDAGATVHVVHVGDSYEASRLILHDRWAEVAKQVKGDLIVSAPSRDFVYFTGSREDLTGLRALAAQSADQGHALTTTLLRWTAQGWEPFS